MIPPFAANLEITPRPPLLPEPDLAQDRARRLVLRNTGHCETVQLEHVEQAKMHRAQRSIHVPVARVALTDPVAQGRRLRDTTPHIRERAAAHQHVVGLPEDEEGIGEITPDLALIAANAATEG